MSRYLEYFNGIFDSTVAEKMKPENRPYVAYSKIDGMIYTVIPKPVVGQPNNEIWYTTVDGNIVTNINLDLEILNHTYENGKGIIVFKQPLEIIGNSDNIGVFGYNSNNVSTIILPNSVFRISAFAFDKLSNLVSIIIPNKITIIDDYAFEGCNSLKSLTLPITLKSIAPYETLGTGITSLTDIYYEGTKEQWNQIEKNIYFNNNITIHCSDGDIAI